MTPLGKGCALFAGIITLIIVVAITISVNHEGDTLAPADTDTTAAQPATPTEAPIPPPFNPSLSQMIDLTRRNAHATMKAAGFKPDTDPFESSNQFETWDSPSGPQLFVSYHGSHVCYIALRNINGVASSDWGEFTSHVGIPNDGTDVHQSQYGVFWTRDGLTARVFFTNDGTHIQTACYGHDNE